MTGILARLRHLQPGITRGAAYSMIFLFALSFLLSAGSYWLAASAVRSSNHRWCSTLGLLTSKPVPRPADPKANPSRENAYVFYAHLKTLERDFGCP